MQISMHSHWRCFAVVPIQMEPDTVIYFYPWWDL